MATAETRRVAVLTLTGEVIIEADVLAVQTVSELKAAVSRRRAHCAPCWQRLLVAGRELQDPEVLSEALPSDEAATIQLVVAPNPWDLLLLRKPQTCSFEEIRRRKFLGDPKSAAAALCGPGDLERHSFAVAAAEALGRGQSGALVRRLFEERDTPIAAAEAEDLLYQLREDFGRYTDRLPNLRAALLEQVLRLLPESKVQKSARMSKLMDVLTWLGPAAVPHIVAWLCLQPRPLDESTRARVEQLRRLSDSARVRLAAKAALSDRSGVTASRVEELAQLRCALLHDAHSSEDAEALMELREQAASQLMQLAAAGPRLRYAVERALRR